MADPGLRPRSPFDLWHPTGALRFGTRAVRDAEALDPEERSQVVVVDVGVADSAATLDRTVRARRDALHTMAILWSASRGDGGDAHNARFDGTAS